MSTLQRQGVAGCEVGEAASPVAAPREALQDFDAARIERDYQPPRPDAAPDNRFLSRDLGWLEFNRRVLWQALDETVPLLERTKFLAIFSSNLDEFAQKRLGILKQRAQAGLFAPAVQDVPGAALLAALRQTIRGLQRVQARVFAEGVRPALAKVGIQLLDYGDLSDDEKSWLYRWYRMNVFPVMTPLAVDPGHRFPFISNLSRNFGVLLAEPGAARDAAGGLRDEPLFARVKIPNVLPQWVRLPSNPSSADLAVRSKEDLARVGAGRFVALRDTIKHHLGDLFPGMEIVETVPFRVTRNAEVSGDEPLDPDDEENLLEIVEEQLKRRRFARAVRLETGPNPDPVVLQHLLDELELTAEEHDERSGPLDYTTLFEIGDLDRPDLKYRKWSPVTPGSLVDRASDIFSVIRRGDLLVHHPYDSFAATAERFIGEASRDPNVLAIKQTIYRTSRDSPFIASLIRAAESGKQVACLVELRARFDEDKNVRFAQMLEKAGVHVAYGVIGLKTHCKAALVVRREGDVLRTYAHLGTGNYNPKTAQLYTDLGLFTCDPGVTDDVVELFNLLTGRSRRDTFDRLLVAPINMKRRFIELIDREIAFARCGVGGRIVAKMNAFEDRDIAERLYEASAAGVSISLFVRGFCCLRSGVPGLSENIRVSSVIGRFLEHSRLYHFGAGKADPSDGEWYIASADWMYRNLHDRVESACPVTDAAGRAHLKRIIEILSSDRFSAWEQTQDGSYRRRRPDDKACWPDLEKTSSFERLMQCAAGTSR